MKPQKWWLIWCTFVFITGSDFWLRLESSHRTILGWIFVKCSYFLKPSYNYVLQISFLSISKKEKMNATFTQEFCVKSVQIRSYFWSEYRKIRTRNNSVFGRFSRSGVLCFYKFWLSLVLKKILFYRR